MTYEEANTALVEVRTLLIYNAIDKLGRQEQLDLAERIEQARKKLRECRLSERQALRKLEQYEQEEEENHEP